MCRFHVIWFKNVILCAITADFVLKPPKSGFNTVRLEQVQIHCFSKQAHEATLGCIFFIFLSPKSDKQWKVLRDCLKNWPTGGPSDNQTFPRGCNPQDSLITLGTSLGQIFPDNPFGLFTVCTISNNNPIPKVFLWNREGLVNGLYQSGDGWVSQY